MSVDPNPTRIIPLTGTESERISASASILVSEIHSTNDTLRLFLENLNLTTVFHSAADQAARIALGSSSRGVKVGDICLQTDNSILYIANTDDGDADGEWTPIADTASSTPQFTRIGIGVAADGTRALTINDTIILRSTAALADGAAAAAGTLTNAPTAGNPTKWIPIDDNGTTRHIPAW